MERDNRNCTPAIRQDGSRAEVRAATRLAMANRDLLESDSYLYALDHLPTVGKDEEDKRVLQRALINSGIIFCAKSFGTNRGAEIADRKIEIDSFSDVDKELHKQLMDIRNRVIAHSDAEVVPAQIIDHEHEGILVIATPKFDALEEIDPKRIKKQISSLLTQVQKQLHEYSDLLRAIPGALGSRVVIEIHDEPEPK